MEGKTSVLFGAISIVVVAGIVALMTMMPQSASLADTDQLRQAVDTAARKHKLALGLLGGPTVTVGGVLPPTFKKGDEGSIAVLGARELNTEIPGRLDEIKKDLQAAVEQFPQASADVKAAAYSLTGQLHAAKAQYYQQSAGNAAEQTAEAIVAIDTEILSIQKRLRNVKQISPLTETQDNVAAKMKTEAETEAARLKTAIEAKQAEIAALETKRAGQIAQATKHGNKASELWTLSAAAERQARRDYQEKSFAEAKLANQMALAAEDSQKLIDAGKSALESLNIELASAQGAIESASGVLKGFSDKRETAKSALTAEAATINAAGKEIAAKADAMIAACGKIEADVALAAKEYAAAAEAMKQCRQHASDSADSIGGHAGVLMGQAWSRLSVVSSRQSVAATAARIKSLWETAAIKGEAPKFAEMTAFAGKVDADKTTASESFAAAAELYKKATAKTDKYKWSYQCRELQARRARHRLTGDADDKTRASALEMQLESLKGFPYVDNAL